MNGNDDAKPVAEGEGHAVSLGLGSRLSEKFPEGVVRQRKLFRRNRELVIDYVPGHEVVKRLNDVFGLLWSFEIKDKHIDIPNGQVAVLGSLSVMLQDESGRQACNLVVKEQWGGTVVSTYFDTGGIIALHDDLKIAATDALKKCATLFGVALYLYEQDDNVDDEKMKSPPPDPKKLEEKRSAVAGAAADRACSVPQAEALEKILSAEKIDMNMFLSELGVDDMAKLGYNMMGEILTRKHPIWLKFKSKTPEVKK